MQNVLIRENYLQTKGLNQETDSIKKVNSIRCDGVNQIALSQLEKDRG